MRAEHSAAATLDRGGHSYERSKGRGFRRQLARIEAFTPVLEHSVFAIPSRIGMARWTDCLWPAKPEAPACVEICFRDRAEFAGGKISFQFLFDSSAYVFSHARIGIIYLPGAWIDHLGHENPRHTPQRDAQAIHARILRVGYLVIGSDPDENFVKRQSLWPEDRQLFNIDPGDLVKLEDLRNIIEDALAPENRGQ